MDKLNIFNDIHFDETFNKEEIHSYQPTSRNFDNSDEIRILIQHQDLCTLPCESFISISGSVTLPENVTTPYDFIRNGFAFLFEEIRYELNGVEVDKCRNVGITTTMKGYLSHTDDELRSLEIAGWNKTGSCKTYFENEKKFYSLIPLSCLLGFAEDYKKVIVNIKQELIIVRSRTDLNCYKGPDDVKINVEKVEWRVPHIYPNDSIKLELEKNGLLSDMSISIPFRRWEVHELPSLRNTNKDIWTVKTSRDLERPRYVIVAFQEGINEVFNKDSSTFNHCDIRDMKVFLNAESYPYENLN